MLQTRAAGRPTASQPVPSTVAVPWRAELWVYVVLGVVALVAFCVGAGAKGVFGDEAYSLSTALRSWGSLWDHVRNHETNGLLYAALLRMWSELGDSLTWLRYLSALFAAGAVVATAAPGALGGLVAGRGDRGLAAHLQRRGAQLRPADPRLQPGPAPVVVELPGVRQPGAPANHRQARGVGGALGPARGHQPDLLRGRRRPAGVAAVRAAGAPAAAALGRGHRRHPAGAPRADVAREPAPRGSEPSRPPAVGRPRRSPHALRPRLRARSRGQCRPGRARSAGRVPPGDPLPRHARGLAARVPHVGSAGPAGRSGAALPRAAGHHRAVPGLRPPARGGVRRHRAGRRLPNGSAHGSPGPHRAVGRRRRRGRRLARRRRLVASWRRHPGLRGRCRPGVRPGPAGRLHPVRVGRRPPVLRARGRRPHRGEPRHPPLPGRGLGHLRHR